ISRQRITSGFSYGVVMGADGRKWSYVKRMFWEYRPERNTFDQDAGAIAQKAFNTGLAAGYLQSREIAKKPKKMEFFLECIRALLIAVDVVVCGGGVSNLWKELTWRNWYITAGVNFRSLYLKD